MREFGLKYETLEENIEKTNINNALHQELWYIQKGGKKNREHFELTWLLYATMRKMTG